MTPESRQPPQMWSAEVGRDTYAGHDGLTYRHRPRSFADLLTGTHHFDDRTFLVQGERRISYREFRLGIDRARTQLHALGIRAGDRVMVLGYNSPEWVLALWTLWVAGAVPVLGNRWWSSAEIEHALSVLEPRHILADVPLSTAIPTSELTELSAHFGSGPDEVALPPADAGGSEPGEDDPALVLFTSGSSGMPKAVALNRRSVIANQQNILQRNRRFPDHLTAASPQAVSLATTPMFHVGGLSSLVTHLLTGGKIVMAEGRFDAKQILTLIERERVQIWGAVPTMAIRLLEHPDFDSHDLSSLRSWPLGGAPVSTDLLDRIRAKLPNLRERGLSNTWGMTEAGGFLTIADGRDLLEHPGSVGRPYPVVEVRIADPDDDGVGEVLARSPTVMLSYAGVAPDDQPVDAEGWLHTGDLGHLNTEGYLFIDGRRKDIVIRGGENIACPHVEAAITSHPAVLEAAALGLPHPELGEELVAVVVHRSESTAPTEEELRDHLAGAVAYFAIPTRWLIRAEPLPTLAGEKVNKKALIGEFD